MDILIGSETLYRVYLGTGWCSDWEVSQIIEDNAITQNVILKLSQDLRSSPSKVANDDWRG
jgi:hypothetical protein